MKYPYVRVSVFGVARVDLRTATPLAEKDIRDAYGEQPAYITQDATSLTVTFDDAGPTCTYFAQRPADWDELPGHPPPNP